MVVTVADYVGVAGAVASAISQAATNGSNEEAATDDRYGVPVPAWYEYQGRNRRRTDFGTADKTGCINAHGNGDSSMHRCGGEF